MSVMTLEKTDKFVQWSLWLSENNNYCLHAYVCYNKRVYLFDDDDDDNNLNKMGI